MVSLLPNLRGGRPRAICSALAPTASLLFLLSLETGRGLQGPAALWNTEEGEPFEYKPAKGAVEPQIAHILLPE